MNRPGCWDLINPSDAITFLADDHAVALVLVVLLGRGKYGAKEMCEAGREVPLMLFGPPTDWILTTFAGRDIEQVIDDVIDARKTPLAEAAESMLVGDRAQYETAMSELPEHEREEFTRLWNENHTTSLNNIVKAAGAIALALRQKGA